PNNTFADVDGDGFCSDVDCDDNDSSVFPGAPELCDGIDNNCDGEIDEGVLNTYYADADGDGFGDPNNSTEACTQPDGFVVDNTDLCPDDGNKSEPGECGCGELDTDTDGDGTADCNDACPNDPDKVEPGICGCDISDVDSDSDGTADCNDGCPNDPNKVDPGVCGCGVSDIDSDGDGTADCEDDCPNDPDKVEPGTCGCGVSDVDSDGDGTPDCNDGCPDNALLIEPITWYADTDGDGFGDPNHPTQACAQPDGFVEDNTDCDDSDANLTLEGATCDDGDPTTENDEVTADCQCAGEVIAPENDECDQAIELVCGETVMGTNVGASINDPCGGSFTNPGAGVWYTITLEEETIVTLETCNENTEFDTDLSVYTGGCGALECSSDFNFTGYSDGTNIDGVTCDGTFPLDFRAGGLLNAQAGITYYVQVSGYDGTEEGMFALEVSCEAPPSCIPASEFITDVVSDDCADGEGSYTVSVSFSDDGSAEEYNVSNDVNDETAVVAADGSAEFTFPSGTAVNFTASAVGFDGCTVVGSVSFNCPPATPPNDLCGEAISVVCGETVSGNSLNATNTGNPAIGFCGTAPGASGVWYVFEGDGNIITATTCNIGT
ncbi:MAG: hypothetical protein LC650_05300, partial [Actinobacteria bacterium]|nr:hypothetical protein [Actinomycetota bacterium]